MPVLDIFNNDAFKSVSMSEGLDLVETTPDHIGSMGLFNERGIRTESVAIEKRESTLSVIQTSQRASAPQSRQTEKRTLRDFRTVRLAISDRINASELQFIRPMGEEQGVISVMDEITRRLSGPGGLLAQMELTWERMRLGALQGIVLDADDSTIYNYFTEFGIANPAEIAFDLANTSGGALREMVEAQVVIPMKRKAKGMAIRGVGALCSDEFWHALMKNPEIRETYLAQIEAKSLRDGTAYTTFEFAGVQWSRYMGSDDNTKVAISGNKVRFFPLSNSGVFETVFAPGESFAELGQVGQSVYAKVIPDRDREAYVDLEVYSYPLHIARRPDLLLRGHAGAA
jgi:hypothetical protein